MIWPQRHHPTLLSDRLTALDLSWVSGTPPRCHWVYSAKTRYRQKNAPCTLIEASAERCVVEFAELQWAATPGQSVVIYESQVCLGGGIIESAARAGDVEYQNAECPPGAVSPKDDGGEMRAEK